MASRYHKGRLVEWKCRKYLEQKGVNIVFRSAGSRGPADLIAINPVKKEIMLIQVKKGEAKPHVKRQYGILKELEGTYQVKAYIYHKKGKYYQLDPL